MTEVEEEYMPTSPAYGRETQECSTERQDIEHASAFVAEPSFIHNASTDHLHIISQGFEILALAATFLSAIQSGVMNTTLSGLPDTNPVRATNALYLSGLVFDLISACLAFLTSRWFQRLTNAEKHFLQETFTARAKEKSERADPNIAKPMHKESYDREKGDILWRPKLRGMERILIPWYSLSLFVPMLFLVLGTTCMLGGIYTYTWSQHPRPVAIVVTLAGLLTVPFIVGVFAIGRVDQRRKNIILQLSHMQGDW